MRSMSLFVAAATLFAAACERSFLHDLPEAALPTEGQACPTDASPVDVTVAFEGDTVTLAWEHRAPAGYETVVERNAENAGFLEVGRAAPVEHEA